MIGFSLIALGVLQSVSAAQTLVSRNGLLTFNCPTQATIERAYGTSFCPQQSMSGAPYVGTRTSTVYTNAPTSFRVAYSSFSLTCVYQGPSTSTFACAYAGGGGRPLTLTTNNADCPKISAAVPQVSPGLDYRKRSNQIDKRFRVEDKFTCPWTATTDGYYLRSTSVSDGSFINRPGTLTFFCSFRNDRGGANIFGCTYLYDASTGVLSGSSLGVNCPTTLCDAIEPSGMSKRDLSRGNQAIRSRQVDTALLRQGRKKAARRNLARA